MARFSTAILVRGFLNELIQEMELDGISTKNFNVEISQTLWVLKITAETSQTGITENLLKKCTLMITPKTALCFIRINKFQRTSKKQ